MWVAEHEPEVFARVARVLLPKDYLRYRLSGDYVAEMSDASGTLWLDVGNRRWSEGMLAADAVHQHVRIDEDHVISSPRTLDSAMSRF